MAKSGRAKRRLRSVLQALAERSGTDEELSERLNLSGNTVRPRRGELESDGLIAHRGELRTTRSGRKARVWEITIAGWEALRGGVL